MSVTVHGAGSSDARRQELSELTDRYSNLRLYVDDVVRIGHERPNLYPSPEFNTPPPGYDWRVPYRAKKELGELFPFIPGSSASLAFNFTGNPEQKFDPEQPVVLTYCTNNSPGMMHHYVLIAANAAAIKSESVFYYSGSESGMASGYGEYGKPRLSVSVFGHKPETEADYAHAFEFRAQLVAQMKNGQPFDPQTALERADAASGGRPGYLPADFVYTPPVPPARGRVTRLLAAIGRKVAHLTRG